MNLVITAFGENTANPIAIWNIVMQIIAINLTETVTYAMITIGETFVMYHV